jgi:hypothetical protein
MNDNQRIIKLLNRLGETPDRVAQTLQALGHKGTPTWPESCPVANYLREYYGNASVANRILVWKDSEDAPKNFDNAVQTPDVINDFITAFDAGEYPELVNE